MDWLLAIWIIMTVVVFLDFIIPHPLYIISKPFTLGIWFLLLGALFIRWIAKGLANVFDIVTHPAVLSFAAVILILLTYKRLKSKEKKGR
jgi:hypothetical protein